MKKVVCLPGAGLRGVYFGGNANNGTNDGLSYANANNAPSNTNANIGSRNYYKSTFKLIMAETSALAEK